MHTHVNTHLQTDKPTIYNVCKERSVTWLRWVSLLLARERDWRRVRVLNPEMSVSWLWARLRSRRLVSSFRPSPTSDMLLKDRSAMKQRALL